MNSNLHLKGTGGNERCFHATKTSLPASTEEAHQAPPRVLTQNRRGATWWRLAPVADAQFLASLQAQQEPTASTRHGAKSKHRTTLQIACDGPFPVTQSTRYFPKATQLTHEWVWCGKRLCPRRCLHQQAWHGGRSLKSDVALTAEVIHYPTGGGSPKLLNNLWRKVDNFLYMIWRLSYKWTSTEWWLVKHLNGTLNTQFHSWHYYANTKNGQARMHQKLTSRARTTKTRRPWYHDRATAPPASAAT